MDPARAASVSRRFKLDQKSKLENAELSDWKRFPLTILDGRLGTSELVSSLLYIMDIHRIQSANDRKQETEEDSDTSRGKKGKRNE